LADPAARGDIWKASEDPGNLELRQYNINPFTAAVRR